MILILKRVRPLASASSAPRHKACVFVCEKDNILSKAQVLQQSGAHVRTFSFLTIMDKEKLTGTFLQLSNPVGVAASDVGDIFVSDSGHSLICRIPPDSSAI